MKVSTITPAPFQQVIKTSGQVLAAQGDESVAVATVAGVVSFRGKVTEGMSVGRGTPLITILRTTSPTVIRYNVPESLMRCLKRNTSE